MECDKMDEMMDDMGMEDDMMEDATAQCPTAEPVT